MDFGLKDRVAIVTGAGQGIGAATALLLSEEGAKVIVNDLSKDNAEKIASSITMQGGEAVAIQADVGAAIEVNQMVNETIDRFGKIDILVNNAGKGKPIPIQEMMEEQFDEIQRVNLKGVFNVTRSVINHMIEAKYGRVISLSSVAGKVGAVNNLSHYAAAKAGVIGFTKSIARELGKYNITVNTVVPGAVDTQILTSEMRVNIMEKIIKNNPIARMAQPREIACLIAFLASDSAGYITGTVATIDGGFTMC
ncbi:MAG: 3-oxoacyl-ACP reductase FabG [Syntrophaceae bacterium]|nr:3-oxoacyl-ACP reductase FabG [Syntrophaceae bacterium]